MPIKLISVRSSLLEKIAPTIGINTAVLGITHKTIKLPNTIKKACKFISNIKPDVLWLTKDGHINPGLLRTLKNAYPKMKIAMWYGDQRGSVVPPEVGRRIGLLDILLITNECPNQIKMYKKAGIPHVMPFYHSFSADEFQLWNVPITHEVFFGGSRFKATKFPLCTFRSNFINIVNNKFKLVVHGGGWPFPTEKWVLRPQYAKELRKARINLGINHYDIQCYFNRRLFESVASGRLHITYYIPGMEKYFKNKEHLVWFKNANEGIKLIRFYLNNKEEREKIAKTGREFFIEKHSWPVRLKYLKQLLEKVL
jgi:spore maturation protein CgeB